MRSAFVARAIQQISFFIYNKANSASPLGRNSIEITFHILRSNKSNYIKYLSNVYNISSIYFNQTFISIIKLHHSVQIFFFDLKT